MNGKRYTARKDKGTAWMEENGHTTFRRATHTVQLCQTAHGTRGKNTSKCGRYTDQGLEESTRIGNKK